MFLEFMREQGRSGCKHWTTFWKPLGQIDVPNSGIAGGMEPMEWVGAMFPSKIFHTGEFMLLQEDINGRKEKLWQGKALGTTTINYLKGRPRRSDGTDQEKQDRAWGNRQIGLKAVRNAILAVKYMQEKDVNDYMVAQARRIKDMFSLLEDSVLKLEWARYYQANPKLASGIPKDYKSYGWSGEWTKYIKKQGDAFSKKINDQLKEAEKVSKKEAKDLLEAEQKKQKADPSYQIDPLVEEFAENVSRLSDELENYRKKSWGNPFRGL
jgi:hypothetical protein